MFGNFHRWVSGSLVIIFSANSLIAQSIPAPPFGLHWGDSPEKLISWGFRQSLNVTISLPARQPDLRVLKIQSEKGFLPQTQASALEGRFFKGQLFELTVHYSDPTATAVEMENRFGVLRRQTTVDQGPLLQNQQQRTSFNQFVTRTISFHRETLKGSFFLLTFTEEEDLLRKSSEARFSLVYRNNNFRQE